MLRKILGMVVMVIMLLGVFGLTSCIDENIANPFTEEQMLRYLEDKYDSEFVFNQKVFDSDDGKFSKYVYGFSPKEEQQLVLFVVDQVIQSNRIKHWDRILNDSYPHSLLKADFHRIADVFDGLTLDEPSFEELGSHIRYSNIENPPYIINLRLDRNYELNEIDLLAEQLVGLKKYIAEHQSQYKLNDFFLYLFVPSLTTKIMIYDDLQSMVDALQNSIMQ